MRFPDAPTLRGVKHLEELVRARAEGYETAVCFVVQMEGMVDFRPQRRHPPGLRRGAAPGRGGGCDGAGHGVRGHPRQPCHPPVHPGAAVK